MVRKLRDVVMTRRNMGRLIAVVIRRFGPQARNWLKYRLNLAKPYGDRK